MDKSSKTSNASTLVKANESTSTFMKLPFESDWSSLDLAVVGIPWDGGTAVRVGARHGPQQIRAMSARLRHLHPTLGLSPIERCTLADVGDVPVDPFDQAATLANIASFYRGLATAKVMPVTIGGDHLVTLPVLRGIYSKEPFGLVHIDAHSDTANSSADGQKYASSTPFRRAVEEGIVDPKRVVQIGIRGPVRSYEKEEWAKDAGMRIVTMDNFYEVGIEGIIKETRRIMGDGPTYLTVDIDGIDPAFAPGTGTPVIGGITTYECQRILRGMQGLKLIGGDVVEISPPHDINNVTSLVGASLIYEILCLVADAS